VQGLLAKVGVSVETIAVILGSILLAVVFISLLLQVIYRYVLFLPLPWSEEAARFGLVWLGMLAAVVAARRGLHFIFRFGTLFLPEDVRRWLRVAVNLVVIFFLIVLCTQGWVYLGIVSNQTAPATGFNMMVPYSSIFVGGILMLIVYLLEVLDMLLGCISGRRYSTIESEELAIYERLKHWRGGGQASDDSARPLNGD